MTMFQNPHMFQAVIDYIPDFYLKANEIFYESTKGILDAILIGNYFGSQTGLILMVCANMYFRVEKLIDKTKNYGHTIIHHSCGSIFLNIQDLSDLGASIINPIQAHANEMDAPNLKKNYT